MKAVTFSLLVLGLLFSTSFAQLTEKKDITFYGNYSPDSNTIFSIARTKDAKLHFFNIEYSRRIYETKKANLRYVVSFIPFASLSFPTPNNNENLRVKSRALGFAPIGFRIRFNSKKKLTPFISISGGILLFDKSIPNNLGKRLNFTADVGGGFEVNLEKNRSLVFGYKYYHISNAHRGLINPGFDNNIFFIGYRFFFK